MDTLFHVFVTERACIPCRIVDLDSGVSRSVSSVYMRLITQSPHDESTATGMTFRGDAAFVVKTNRPKKKPKGTSLYDVQHFWTPFSCACEPALIQLKQNSGENLDENPAEIYTV